MNEFRMERIEKLLNELRYEIERGMMQNEIDETLTFRFVIPISRTFPKGIVFCEFHTKPMLHYYGMDFEPKLKVVK